MKTRLMAAALFLCLAMPVSAEFKLLAKGYEVDVSNVRLPQSEGGTIGFRECDKCVHMTKRVTSETMWMLDGSRTSLKKFRQALRQIDRGKRWSLTVRHDFEADVIIEVSLQTPPQQDRSRG